MKSDAGIKKKWIVSDARTAHREEITMIAGELNILPVTAVLLYNRGLCEPVSARSFLRTEEPDFYDPFLLNDMDRAVKRIFAAIENGDKIKIYGDYDVDGVTSVSLLYLYLKSKGADTDYYIPCRAGEGYGVNSSAVEAFAAEGVKLIITVDTGITACCEADLASALKMDMIITDHHECHCSIPVCAAVINPRRPDSVYPFKEMAGVGVVFKLICALESSVSPDGYNYITPLCERYADLVAIGTIADVMPLIGENRLIVSMGLRCIEREARPGLAALLKAAATSGDRGARAYHRRRVNSSLVGFVIAPRINAAGRITSASKAVELFLTESRTRAAVIAQELCETNSERQAQEQKIIAGAYEKIKAEHDFEVDRVIVLAQDNWHHGIIGIVASRITERFGLPSILISFEGDCGKGSGRSVKGLNLVEALGECKDLLLKYGGHELAAGLTIERDKLGEFKRRINEYAARAMTEGDLAVTVMVDTVLTGADLTLRQAGELRLLEPYGVANPVPVFELCGAELTEVTPINENRHTRFQIKSDGVIFSAILFGSDARLLGLYRGDIVDFIFNLDINDYQSVQSVQLIIRDIRLCEETCAALASQKRRYAELIQGDKAGCGEDVIPGREEFSDVYLYIKCEIKHGNSEISVSDICHHAGDGRINYIKTKFIIDIFNETGIFVSEMAGEDVYKFTLNRLEDKVNLERSCIYRKLKYGRCGEDNNAAGHGIEI